MRRLTTASNRPGSCLLPQPELAGVQHRRGATHGALPLHEVLPLELCSAGNGGRRGLQKGRPSSGLAGANHWETAHSKRVGTLPLLAEGRRELSPCNNQPLSKVGRHIRNTPQTPSTVNHEHIVSEGVGPSGNDRQRNGARGWPWWRRWEKSFTMRGMCDGHCTGVSPWPGTAYG